MPRHGPRELRGPGDGGRPGQVVRLGQGRPRGATRPRRRLHGGHPGPDRVRAAGPCRSSAPPTGAPSTPGPTSRRSSATGCRPSAASSQALGEAWVSERAQVVEQADALVGAVQRELRLAEALHEEAAGGGRAGAAGAPLPPAGRSARDGLDTEALVEQVVAGLGPASIPSGAASARRRSSPGPPSSSCACAAHRRGGADAAHARHMATAHARRHGGRRHLRPPGRRVLPLLDRRPLARPALREDAHRPGAAGPGLPARVAGRRAGRVSRRGDRDPRLRAARPLDPRGRALLLLRRRRRRGGGRARHVHRWRSCTQILPAPTWSRRRPSGTGSPTGGNWEGRSIPVRPVGAPARAPARGRGGPPACSPPPGRRGCSRPGTRRC